MSRNVSCSANSRCCHTSRPISRNCSATEWCDAVAACSAAAGRTSVTASVCGRGAVEDSIWEGGRHHETADTRRKANHDSDPKRARRYNISQMQMTDHSSFRTARAHLRDKPGTHAVRRSRHRHRLPGVARHRGSHPRSRPGRARNPARHGGAWPVVRAGFPRPSPRFCSARFWVSGSGSCFRPAAGPLVEWATLALGTGAGVLCARGFAAVRSRSTR